MLSRLLLLLLAFASFGAGAATPDELLEPEKAFRFSIQAIDPTTVEVRYAIAEGYYMYRDKFRFAARTAGVQLGDAVFPPGKLKEDEFFGKVETYRGKVAIKVPVLGDWQALALEATSQGCADIGVCYPPLVQSAQVLAAGTSGTVVGRSGLAEFGGRAVPAQPRVVNDESRFEQLLAAGNVWLIVAGFFVAGVLLTFTPCVLPMLPILAGLIVGDGRGSTRRRALLLSLAYVGGMAVTYTLIGIAAALSGSLLSGALQNPWVLSVFALVFVALALSMFGFYDLQLPGTLRAKLHTSSGALKGGQYGTVAIMGVLSAAIVSPCIAAPLAGALLYISQTRDVVLGGSALFAMALGMGVPLVAVGVSEGALLPKSGPWMKTVKHFFGVLLLGVAIWIVSPVAPPLAVMLAWAALLIISAIYLHALDPLPQAASGYARFWKGVGVIALVAGAALVVGALAGSRDPLQPLARLAQAPASQSSELHFERVRTMDELDAKLRTATAPVMLDFYADWCVSCKEMERYTFSDPQVRARLSQMVLLQIDVTANTSQDQALLKRFRLFGPPGIVFFDRTGRELAGLRVIGYQPAERFVTTLDAARERWI